MANRNKKRDKDTFYTMDQVNQWVQKGVSMSLLPKTIQKQSDVDNVMKWVDLLGKKNIIVENKNRYNQPNPADYDGMGNFSRFGKPRKEK